MLLLSDLETLPTAGGRKLLISGWWGLVRHPNFLGEILINWSWVLPAGNFFFPRINVTNSIIDFFLCSKSCRTRGFVGVLLANFHHFSFADAMPTNQHEKSQKIRKRMEFLLRKSTIQPHSQSVLDNIFYYCTTMKKSKFTLCEMSKFCPKSRSVEKCTKYGLLAQCVKGEEVFQDLKVTKRKKDCHFLKENIYY